MKKTSVKSTIKYNNNNNNKKEINTRQESDNDLENDYLKNNIRVTYSND